MKVCLVGHLNNELDEGVRIVGKSIAIELKKKNVIVKTLDISSIKDWAKIRKFKPDIIHFVLTPSWQGIFFSKLISVLSRNSKTVMSAIHPNIPSKKILKFFSPDLTLVQSKESEMLFNSIGFKTDYLYNGVDLTKFTPVKNQKKNLLRKKYRIPQDKFVVLHLASFQRARNLDIFKIVQNEEIYVLLIGRVNENADQELIAELKDAGCDIRIKHFNDIEEIFNLSDCYIFPTIERKACIQTPLSVLEAMSCNLPIITTKFGSLYSLFHDVEGVFWLDNVNYVSKHIKTIQSGTNITTRENIRNYSWENIIKQLEIIYEKALQ